MNENILEKNTITKTLYYSLQRLISESKMELDI